MTGGPASHPIRALCCGLLRRSTGVAYHECSLVSRAKRQDSGFRKDCGREPCVRPRTSNIPTRVGRTRAITSIAPTDCPPCVGERYGRTLCSPSNLDHPHARRENKGDHEHRPHGLSPRTWANGRGEPCVRPPTSTTPTRVGRTRAITSIAPTDCPPARGRTVGGRTLCSPSNLDHSHARTQRCLFFS